MAKTVSIIIPYYRKLYWIKKTLKSIFAQTYKNYEIIIIYDDTNKYDLNKIQNTYHWDKIIYDYEQLLKAF